MDDITLGRQEFGQISAILAGNAGDQSDLVDNLEGLCLYKKTLKATLPPYCTISNTSGELA